MKVFQKTISLNTKKMYDFVKITDKVQEALEESKLSNGIVFVNCPHNTASVILQEDDGTIFQDMIDMFDRILPLKEKYAHDSEGNENATAHQKSNLLGTSVSIPFKDKKLQLGTWQDVFFVELFEAKNRKVMITIIGE